MSFWAVIYQNIKFHMKSYLAYFASATFAVCIFYLYTSLLFHPILLSEYMPRGFVQLIYLVEAVIALFSVLFIHYSLSHFLQNRYQEIALYQLVGMSNTQIRKIFFWENFLVGMLASGLGVVIGSLLSPLFFLGVSVVLSLPDAIPYYFYWQPIMCTVLFFLLLFFGFGISIRRLLRKRSLLDFFRQNIQDRIPPAFSLWLSLLGWGCLIALWLLSQNVNLAQLAFFLLPIIVLALLGTYLFIKQCSIGLMNWIQRIPAFFYQKTTIIVLSEFRMRLQQNTSVLFIVTILMAMVLSAVGVTMTYYTEAEKVALQNAPHHLSIEGEITGLSSSEVAQRLKKEGVVTKRQVTFSVLPVRVKESPFAEKEYMHLISVEDYNRVLQLAGKPPLSLGLDEVAYVINSSMHQTNTVTPDIPQVTLQVGNHQKELIWKKKEYQLVFNEHDLTRSLWIVPQKVYQELQDDTLSSQMQVYQFTDWKKSKLFFDKVNKQLDPKEQLRIKGTYSLYELMKQIFAPLTFVCLFIGCLFFLAAGSILYFRLLSELPREENQLKVLRNLGYSRQDSKRMLTWKTAIFFFFPYVGGVCLSAISMRLFGQLFPETVWSSFVSVSLIFLFVQVVYYVWSRKMMFHQLGLKMPS